MFHRNDSARTQRESSAGSSLIVALGATIPLLIAGGALLATATQQSVRAESDVAVARARDASTSGAHDALAQLVANPNFTGTYDLALGGTASHVIVTSWANDHVDNDGNGQIDEAAEANFITVSAEGTINEQFDANHHLINRSTRSGSSVTTAIVQKTQLNLALNQSFYVDDPNVGFKFSGTQFLISGNDTNVDGTAGPQSPIPGIGTTGDPTLIKNQIAKNQKNCVVGKGANPSVFTVTDLDLVGTMNSFKPLATLTWNGPNDSYGGAIGDRTNLNPIVAYAKGNLKLTGGSTGCGILVVDGNLTVDGKFDFVGLMCIAGSVTFNGGGGNKDLHGGLMTLGDVTGTDVNINGTVQLRYSSQALSILNTKLSSGVSLVAWTQK